MTKVGRLRLFALASLFLFLSGGGGAVAGNIFARSEYGIRYISQAAAPPNCKNPDRACTWLNSADSNLYLHTTGGVEVPATLSITGVTAGTYTNASVTFDQYGRVTAAAAGAAPGAGGYNSILANGTPVTSRATANLIGPGITCVDNAGLTRSDCTIPTPQLATASFTATDTATLSWSNRGGTQYIDVGTPIVTDGLGGVTFYLTGVSSTGATLHASAPFTGTVAVFVVSQ